MSNSRPLSLRDLTLRGRVISGRGTAAQIKAFTAEVINFFGEPPVRGSLNLALDRPVRFDPERVEFVRGKRSFFWAGEIDGMSCLVTRAKGHPLHIIEIIAPCKLRDKFQLHDGDWLELKVSPDSIKNLSWRTKAIWNIFWRFRECWYVSKIYRTLIGPFWLIRRLATQSPQYHANLWNRKKLRSDISVCHINLARNPKLRGGERQTEILVEALAVEGVARQRVVVLRHGPLSHRFRNSPDLEVCRVRSRFSAVFACRGASLLHAHEAHATQAAYAASLLFGKQYLITRRLTKPVRSNSYSSAVYRNAQTVVALTEAVEKSLRERFPEISIVRIPDAWNPEYPDPDGVRKIKEKFSDKFIVGHAAAMDGPEKGHSILLQAARALQQDAPDIQIVLLGSGRLEEEFRQQAESLTNVYFAGWVEDPITWIAAFDLFAFPSLIEPLGSTLLDVLRAGVPIVASRVDGIPEVITEGCGILVPPGDVEVLAEQLLRLYRSEGLRRSLSEKGVERAKEYSPELIAKEHIRVYQDHGLILD